VAEAVAVPPTAAPPAPLTADDLLRLPTGMGQRYELVEGELKRMPPSGAAHGQVVSSMTAALFAHVRSQRAGAVFGAETGFVLSRAPDTVRAPDVAFVAASRIPAEGLPPGFFLGAPDLAVEVVSPGDTAAEVQAKTQGYFDAGTRQVWLIYPDTRQVAVFRSARESHIFSAGDTLDGGELLPGFALPVAELFD
jgi:Uma2 family endonuclease